MMKRAVFALFITLLLWPNFTCAQSSTRDSLFTELRQADPEDTLTFLIYYYIGVDWMETSLDSADSWSYKALSFAEKLDYERGQAYAYSQLGVISNMRENYLEAAYRFEQCLNHSNSMPLLKRSFMVGNIALMHEEVGNFEKALEFALRCLKMREEIKDTIHIAYACFNVGSLHQKLGNLDDAMRFHTRALELRKEITGKSDEYNVIEDSYCAIAELQQQKGQWQHAIRNFRQALALIKPDDGKTRTWHEADIFEKLGEINLNLNRQDSAFFFFEKALELNRVAGSGRFSATASTLLAMGRAHLSLGSPALAISELQEARALIDTLDVLPLQASVMLELSNAYEAQGDLRNALDYKKRYVAINDSLINREKVNSIREMQTRFETEKKDQAIMELSAEKELAEARSQQQKTLLVSMLAGIILVLIATLLIFSAYRQKEKTNQLLEKRNAEKEALLKEIHHRVKNNLQVISSLLNLQSASLSDQAALDAIKDGQHRVKSIALIHQKLYQTEDLSKVDFQEYCEQLVSFLSSTFRMPGKDIECSVDASGIQLDIDTAVPLGLIINELVTNAYKYAFINQSLGRIDIQLSETSEGLRLELNDNGCGLPEGFDPKQSKSLGMKLVSILSRQLKGTLHWETAGGTRYVIDFKETQARKMTA